MRKLALFTILAFMVMPFPALSAEEAGVIKTSRGSAQILRDGESKPATVGTGILESDSIVTGADGVVGITLKDNTRLTAGPDTTMDLNKFSFNTTTHDGAVDASVKRGSLAVISGKIAKSNPDSVRFSTPTVTLGVRGTRFIIEAGN
jgi:hypothetical protein